MNRAVAHVLLPLTLLVGCQEIIGIESRTHAARDEPRMDSSVPGSPSPTVDPRTAMDSGVHTKDASAPEAGPEAGPEGPSEEACKTYCGYLDGACNEQNNATVFPSPAYCEAVCAHFPPGADRGANTFECRFREASLADRFKADPREIAPNCRAASPGSGGTCGSTCEAYCQLFASICPGRISDEDCMNLCPLLVDEPVAADIAFGGVDTIQCRLAHLSAATEDPTVHCPHADLLAQELTPCVPEAPTCETYCGLLMNACTEEDTQQYESLDACLHTCNGMVLGKAPDPTGDTVACRRYHAYSAVKLGPVHCTHAGPGGDGHCGLICQSYCDLTAKLCPDAFQSAYGDGNASGGPMEACRVECAQLVGIEDPAQHLDLGYNVAEARKGGANIQCRLYHLSESASGAAACEAAVGRGPCSVDGDG